MQPPPLALAYHGVAAVPLRSDFHCLLTSPRALRRHIRALRGWGHELVTFGELALRAAEGRAAGCAALTFDDGLADNLHMLAPLLAAEGAPATVFVVTGWLGGEHPDAPGHRILTASEVRELRRRGIEIGAHTVTHPRLTQLHPEAAKRELAGSRAQLEELLDERVDVAAYPYGDADRSTEHACRAAGLRAACRVDGTGSWGNPFALPRQNMGNASTLAGLRLKRTGHFERAVRRAPLRTIRRRRRQALGALQRVTG